MRAWGSLLLAVGASLLFTVVVLGQTGVPPTPTKVALPTAFPTPTPVVLPSPVPTVGLDDLWAGLGASGPVSCEPGNLASWCSPDATLLEYVGPLTVTPVVSDTPVYTGTGYLDVYEYVGSTNCTYLQGFGNKVATLYPGECLDWYEWQSSYPGTGYKGWKACAPELYGESGSSISVRAGWYLSATAQSDYASCSVNIYGDSDSTEPGGGFHDCELFEAGRWVTITSSTVPGWNVDTYIGGGNQVGASVLARVCFGGYVYSDTVGPPPVEISPTEVITEDLFYISHQCAVTDTEYVAWEMESFADYREDDELLVFEIPPGNVGPYTVTLDEADLRPTWFWRVSDLVPYDGVIDLSLSWDNAPWYRYGRWYCADEDMVEVVPDGAAYSWDWGRAIGRYIGIEDGEAMCAPLPVSALTEFLGVIRGAVSWFAGVVWGPDGEDAVLAFALPAGDDYEVCIFPRVVTLRGAAAVVNPFLLVLAWAGAGLFVYVVVTKE